MPKVKTKSGSDIRFKATPDHENPQDKDGDNVYELELFATDDAGNVGTQLLSISVEMVILSTTSSNNIRVSIFPNPASSYITTSLNEILHFKLYSLTGKLVKEELDYTLDIHDVSQGTYLLSIRSTEEKELFQGRVIIGK